MSLPYSPPVLTVQSPVRRKTRLPVEVSRPNPIRVVAVDDHRAIRDAIAATLDTEPDMELCGTAATAQEALDLVRRTDPDVAVIDINLGEEHGLDLIADLRSEYPHLEIIVFSMYDRSVYADAALKAGARSYVAKSEPTEAVVNAIRAAVTSSAASSRRNLPRRFTSKRSDPDSEQ